MAGTKRKRASTRVRSSKRAKLEEPSRSRPRKSKPRRSLKGDPRDQLFVPLPHAPGELPFDIGDAVAVYTDEKDYLLFAVVRGFCRGPEGEPLVFFTWLNLRENTQGSLDSFSAGDFELGPTEPIPQPFECVSHSLAFKKSVPPLWMSECGEALADAATLKKFQEPYMPIGADAEAAMVLAFLQSCASPPGNDSPPPAPPQLDAGGEGRDDEERKSAPKRSKRKRNKKKTHEA